MILDQIKRLIYFKHTNHLFQAPVIDKCYLKKTFRFYNDLREERVYPL